MKIISSFIHPQVVPNLYDFSIEHKKYILKTVGNQTPPGPHWVP